MFVDFSDFLDFINFHDPNSDFGHAVQATKIPSWQTAKDQTRQLYPTSKTPKSWVS